MEGYPDAFEQAECITKGHPLLHPNGPADVRQSVSCSVFA